MTHQEIIQRFENDAIAEGAFHHVDHVRLAFAYLCEYPALPALERFVTALKRFAAARGKAQLYHETITHAYLLLDSPTYGRIAGRGLGCICPAESGSSGVEGRHPESLLPGNHIEIGVGQNRLHLSGQVLPKLRTGIARQVETKSWQLLIRG